MEIKERIQNIFQFIFDDENLEITDETNAADIEGWDSLTYMSLINEIESEFNIKFTTNEIIKMENVGDIINVVGAKIGL